jgi:hypothetical protein
LKIIQLFTQMCDKIESHLHLEIDGEKKMECLDKLVQVYKSIQSQSSFKEKKTRIISLIELLMDWEDVNLKSIFSFLIFQELLEGKMFSLKKKKF